MGALVGESRGVSKRGGGMAGVGVEGETVIEVAVGAGMVSIGVAVVGGAEGVNAVDAGVGVGGGAASRISSDGSPKR